MSRTPYSQNKRVVVTGLGALSPIGLNVADTWKNALEGHSGVDRITHFDSTGCSVTFAAEVKNYDPTGPTGPFKPSPTKEVTLISSKKDVKKLGRFIQLGLAAGFEAYGDSKIDSYRSEFDASRFGVNIGVGMGGLGEVENTHSIYKEKGFSRISPFFIPSVIPNMVSGHLSIQLELKGPNLCNVTACSSSAHSIGEAYHLIRRGDADIMLAGGAEAVITPLGVGGFAAMRALSTRNEEPKKASRPFDSGRDGFVIGEGAAAIILEEYEFAKKRGAKIYAEILGYGISSDAYHMTLPAEEGEGGYRAMKMALESSGLSPEKIHYINAHGTSTPAGDVEEATAIKKLFPNAQKHLHISSTKSMTGHLLGASGAIEAIFSIKAVYEDKIPPTINLENIEPKCAALGLNFTPNQMVKKTVENALSNSFGFGGTNACLIVGKI